MRAYNGSRMRTINAAKYKVSTDVGLLMNRVAASSNVATLGTVACDSHTHITSMRQNTRLSRGCVTKPLARLLEPLRIATILNIYLSNGM